MQQLHGRPHVIPIPFPGKSHELALAFAPWLRLAVAEGTILEYFEAFQVNTLVHAVLFTAVEYAPGAQEVHADEPGVVI